MRQLRTVEEGRAEAEVFAGIRRAAARVASGALSRTAYDRLRDPDDLSSIRIGQRWGWVEACKLAGVTPGGRYAGAGAPRVWSAEQCEEHLALEAADVLAAFAEVRVGECVEVCSCGSED